MELELFVFLLSLMNKVNDKNSVFRCQQYNPAFFQIWARNGMKTKTGIGKNLIDKGVINKGKGVKSAFDSSKVKGASLPLTQVEGERSNKDLIII